MKWDNDKNYYIKHQIFDMILQSKEFGMSKSISIADVTQAIDEFVEKLETANKRKK